MKLTYTFISLFLFYSPGVFSQLSVRDVAFWPTTEYLGSVTFYDEMRGWVSGKNGLILKTTNGGETWTQLNTGFNIPPYNLILLDSLNLFLNSQIYSTDGGNTWQAIPFPPNAVIKYLHPFDAETWIAAGDDGLIIKTTNMGSSWVTIMQEMGARSSGISFIDNLNGWYSKYYSSQSGLYKTTDGGITWSFIYSEFITDQIFVNNYLGYGIGSGPNLYKSTDGGLSWNKVLSVEYFREFYPVNENRIYAWSGFNTNSNGGPILYYSDNGGARWSKVLSGNFRINDVSVINNTAFTVGEAGYIAKAGDLVNFRSLTGDYMSAVYAFRDKAMIAGWGGELYMLKDNGETWEYIESDIYGGPNSITFTGGDSIGIIAGRKVWRSSNGGHSWHDVQIFNEGIYRVYKDLNGEIYILNVDLSPNKLYRSSDYGLTWLEVPLPPHIGRYSTRHFFPYDSNNLWITIYEGNENFFRTTNGGNTWELVSTDLAAYQFFSPDSGIGFVNGQLSYSSDGGLTWDQMDPNYYWHVTQHFGFERNFSFFLVKGYYLPGDETLYDYTFYFNNGVHVQPLLQYVAKYFSGFSFYDRYNGWIAAGRQVFRVTADVPVELSGFHAYTEGTDAVLQWSTASETNNNGFEIQRSVDEFKWFAVGFLPGIGTSSETHLYFFRNRDLLPGKYFYRLKQTDLNGTSSYSEVIGVEINSPAIFSLNQNYPNPFNPSTTISFSLPKTEYVTLKVYNTLGEEIKTLVNSQLDAGEHKINFDASNVSSGVYFYKITAGNYTNIKKLQILK